MWILCVICWLVPAVFYVRGGKKGPFFERAADGILSLPHIEKLYTERVKLHLKQLYPSQPWKESCKKFYHRKIVLLIKIWLAGIHLIAVISYKEEISSILEDGNVIKRSGQEIQAGLMVQTENDRETEIEYEIRGKLYSPDEVEDLCRQFKSECEALILGENQSLDEVRSDLVLRESYEAYPMQFSWESTDYSLIDEEGTVHNEKLLQEIPVSLTVTMTYEEQEYTYTLPVSVYPKEKTQEEEWKESVLSAISAADEEQKYTDTLKLPSEIEGKKVVYSVMKENSPVLYVLFLVGIIVVLYFVKDEDLKKETQTRRHRLELKYPEFVSKFQLLLGSGMSVRSIIVKLSGDASLGDELRQELLLVVRDMKNGISVRDSLDRFGKRTAHPLYIKFCALIIQNQKKGTADLFEQLSGEVREAFSLRKMHARQKGEEVGTKLLGPMMLMLVVVLAVLMVPAFLSFQI